MGQQQTGQLMGQQQQQMSQMGQMQQLPIQNMAQQQHFEQSMQQQPAQKPLNLAASGMSTSSAILGDLKGLQDINFASSQQRSSGLNMLPSASQLMGGMMQPPQ